MRKIIFLTVVLALVVFALPTHAGKAKDVNVANEPGVTVLNDDTNPVPVTVQSGESIGPPVYRVVGVTDATTNGDGGGLSGMNALCDAEYQGARMCTMKEVFETGITTNLPNDAWVIPTVVTEVVLPDGSFQVRFFDGTTRALPPPPQPWSINCYGWGTPFVTGTGAVVTSSLEATTASCAATMSVLCCAP